MAHTLNKVSPINCIQCGNECKWVTLGMIIGSYWYCKVCKKEEKEWIIPSATKVQASEKWIEIIQNYTGKYINFPIGYNAKVVEEDVFNYKINGTDMLAFPIEEIIPKKYCKLYVYFL